MAARGRVLHHLEPNSLGSKGFDFQKKSWGKGGKAKRPMLGRDVTGIEFPKACDLDLSRCLLGRQARREGLPLVSELNPLPLPLRYIN